MTEETAYRVETVRISPITLQTRGQAAGVVPMNVNLSHNIVYCVP